MVAHGAFAHIGGGSNLLVVEAAGDELGDFELAVGQAGKGRGPAGRAGIGACPVKIDILDRLTLKHAFTVHDLRQRRWNGGDIGLDQVAAGAGAIKVLGIVLVLASILIMNTDFSKLRNSVFVGHVIESMTFKPNAWWTEKSQDMDLFKERTGIALEPTVQESPWYFVR